MTLRHPPVEAVPVLLLALIALMCGCSATLDRNGMEQLVTTTVRDTRGAVYYQGRKGGLDHFRVRWNIGTRHIRVPASDSPVTNAFPFTADRQLWRGAPFMHLSGPVLSRALSERLNASPQDQGPSASSYGEGLAPTQ